MLSLYLSYSYTHTLSLSLLCPHRPEKYISIFPQSYLTTEAFVCIFLIFLPFFDFFFKTLVTSAIPRPFKELSRFLVCFRCLIPLLFCVRELERR